MNPVAPVTKTLSRNTVLLHIVMETLSWSLGTRIGLHVAPKLREIRSRWGSLFSAREKRPHPHGLSQLSGLVIPATCLLFVRSRAMLQHSHGLASGNIRWKAYGLSMIMRHWEAVRKGSFLAMIWRGMRRMTELPRGQLWSVTLERMYGGSMRKRFPGGPANLRIHG